MSTDEKELLIRPLFVTETDTGWQFRYTVHADIILRSRNYTKRCAAVGGALAFLKARDKVKEGEVSA